MCVYSRKPTPDISCRWKWLNKYNLRLLSIVRPLHQVLFMLEMTCHLFVAGHAEVETQEAKLSVAEQKARSQSRYRAAVVICKGRR